MGTEENRGWIERGEAHLGTGYQSVLDRGQKLKAARLNWALDWKRGRHRAHSEKAMTQWVSS